MESSKGSNDALNTPNASAPKSSDSIEPIDSLKSIDSKKPSKYAAMVLRSQYPSRWRFLIAFAAVVISASVMFTYAALDAYDILPGPLTFKTQHISSTVFSPRALLRSQSLAKGVSYGKPINRNQAKQLVDSLIKDPAFSDSTSAVIMDANGKVIASHEENAPREPASTLKTLTAAVASRTLDMGSTLNTQVFLLPKVGNDEPSHNNSVRKIVLRGNGDMLLGVGENDWHHTNGRAGLATLAKRTALALKLDNIREVSLAVDDSLFGEKRAPDLIYKTDTERRFYAQTSSMAIDNARQRDLKLQGVDADAPTDFPLSDPHPAESVGSVFAKLLSDQGIKIYNSSEDLVIKVSQKKSLISNNSHLLAQVSSAPLNEVMTYMLRHSDNTLAEEFGRLTALAAHKRNSPEGAVDAIKEGLRKLHVDTRDLNMSDCSGLSPESTLRVMTLAQVQMLNIKANSGGASAAEGLSLPGLVGTARKRLADESSAGFLRVKTGTLSEVTSMTGNVSRRGGGVITFAVAANKPKDFWGAFVAINKFIAQLPNL